MKKLVFILAIGFAGYYGYQKYYANDLYGEWQLDADAMAEQLVQSGASQSAVNTFRQQLGNGHTTTTIAKDTISLKINNDRVDFAYETIDHKEGCTTIRSEGKTLDYCVKGNTLEVHNQQNEMFEVYKRL